MPRLRKGGGVSSAELATLKALRDLELERAQTFRKRGARQDAEWKSAVAFGIEKACRQIGHELPPATLDQIVP